MSQFRLEKNDLLIGIHEYDMSFLIIGNRVSLMRRLLYPSNDETFVDHKTSLKEFSHQAQLEETPLICGTHQVTVANPNFIFKPNIARVMEKRAQQVFNQLHEKNPDRSYFVEIEEIRTERKFAGS